MADSKDLQLVQGKTFSLVLRWETEPVIFKPITAIQQVAPVQMTVTGHGIPDGWRCAVTNVKGMTEINAEANKVKASDYNPVTVIDANTVEINAINAAGFKAYSSGGYLQYNTPVDLTGYTARMQIKDKVGGTVLASSLVGDAQLNIITLTIDAAAKTITLLISATDTAAIAWRKGVFELEMVSATGVVTAILTGTVAVSKEVTT
jgi:hypothetical protein